MVIYKETVYQVVHLVHLKEKRSLFLFQIKAGKKKKKEKKKEAARSNHERSEEE